MTAQKNDCEEQVVHEDTIVRFWIFKYAHHKESRTRKNPAAHAAGDGDDDERSIQPAQAVTGWYTGPAWTGAAVGAASVIEHRN